jgi:RNA polymerase sigma factor (sigma-70 family)
MENLSDHLVWKSLKNGDLNAFSILFKSYYPRLYSYGLKISKDTHLTEDSLQDFFLYVYEHRENLSDIDTIAPYLFSSYRRLLIKNIQKKSRVITFGELNTTVVDIQFNPEEVLTNQENETFKNKNITKLLNNLPKRQKEAMYLKYYSNLKTNDIAVIMDVNYQSAVNTIHKAITNLKEEVSLINLFDS